MTKRTPNEIVKEFYEAFDEPIHDGAPSASEDVISDDRLWLKTALIIEEVSEFIDAAYRKEAGNLIREAFEQIKEQGLDKNPTRDVVEMFDALLDIEVVVEGPALEMNLPMAAGLNEVHRGNMSKLGKDGKPMRSDGITPASDGEVKPKGKIIKGPDYIAPDLAQVLRNHGADV